MCARAGAVEDRDGKERTTTTEQKLPRNYEVEVTELNEGEGKVGSGFLSSDVRCRTEVRMCFLQ